MTNQAAETHCDFCNCLNPSRRFRAVSFEAEALTSRGDWLACGECAALVDADEWEKLLDRVVEATCKPDPWERKVVRAALEKIYAKFRESRLRSRGEARHSSAGGRRPRSR